MKKGFHWILEGETSKLCVMYRTLVFGADGRVGSRLAAYLEEHGLEVVKCGRGFCDLKDLSALKRVLLSSGATHVVNCAAVSGLEACLDDPETAHRVNAMAPEMMARICRLEGMRFIHLSTDYVLDGTEGLIRVFLYADIKVREERVRERNLYADKDVLKNIHRIDRERRDYNRYYAGRDWEKPENYDLLINTTQIGVDGAVQLIKDYLKMRGLL